jgi:ribosomal protein L27
MVRQLGCGKLQTIFSIVGGRNKYTWRAERGSKRLVVNAIVADLVSRSTPVRAK